LKAALEAAHAGMTGTGLAFVLDEVRNLALWEMEPDRKTANLIEGGVMKIKKGLKIVSKTNGAFSRAAIGAKKVEELEGEISAASNDPAQGIEEINRAILALDEVVQKNAAKAEKSTSTSEEIQAQSEQMKGFVIGLLALVRGRSRIGVVSVKDFHSIGVSRGSI